METRNRNGRSEEISVYRSPFGGGFVRIEVHPEDVKMYGRPPMGDTFHNINRLFQASRFTKPLVKLLLLRGWSLVQAGDWDINAVPMEKIDVYKVMMEISTNLENFKGSKYYERAKDQIESGKAFRHKKREFKTVAELDAFFGNYLVEMVKSLKTGGYVESKGADVGRVMIGRSGDLIKGNKGRHRFAAAQIASVDSVPVEIGVIHEIFARRHNLVRNGKIEVAKLVQAIRAVGNRVQWRPAGNLI